MTINSGYSGYGGYNSDTYYSGYSGYDDYSTTYYDSYYGDVRRKSDSQKILATGLAAVSALFAVYA